MINPTAAPAIHLQGSHHLDQQCLFGDVDVCLPAGQWTSLLGRSGAGKSTLLRLIAGLPCAGCFQGYITASDDNPVSDRVSYMAQSDMLLPWMSILDNVVLGARLRKQKPDKARALHLLERVGLLNYVKARPAALSGGMRQRTALVRTLMEERPIALLDEPFSALDASTRSEMQELSAEMLHGKTVLLVTHEPAEALRLAHQVLVLNDQQISPWPLPPTSPIRDPYASETVTSQAELLDYLRVESKRPVQS